MFLSHSDIQRLTGKKRWSAQIRWLQKNGYRHDVNGLGQPIVAEAEVARKLVGGSGRSRSAEPNWDAIYATAA